MSYFDSSRSSLVDPCFFVVLAIVFEEDETRGAAVALRNADPIPPRRLPLDLLFELAFEALEESRELSADPREDPSLEDCNCSPEEPAAADGDNRSPEESPAVADDDRKPDDDPRPNESVVSAVGNAPALVATPELAKVVPLVKVVPLGSNEEVPRDGATACLPLGATTEPLGAITEPLGTTGKTDCGCGAISSTPVLLSS